MTQQYDIMTQLYDNATAMWYNDPATCIWYNDPTQLNDTMFQLCDAMI